VRFLDANGHELHRAAREPLLVKPCATRVTLTLNSVVLPHARILIRDGASLLMNRENRLVSSY